MHSESAIAADWGGAEDIAVMTATGGDPVPEWAAGRTCGGSAVTQHGDASAIRWGLGAHAETCSILNKNGRHERVRTALVAALRNVLGPRAMIKTEAAVDADGRPCAARADNTTRRIGDVAYFAHTHWHYFDVVISSVLGRDNANRSTAEHQAALKVSRLAGFLSAQALRDVKFHPVAISTGGSMSHATAEVLRRLVGPAGVHSIITAAMIGNATAIRDVVAAAVDAPAAVVQRWLGGTMGDGADAAVDPQPDADDAHVGSASDDERGAVGDAGDDMPA
jgi:hypothetical protein